MSPAREFRMSMEWNCTPRSFVDSGRGRVDCTAPVTIIDSFHRHKRYRGGRWDPRLIVSWKFLPRTSGTSRIFRFRAVGGQIRYAAIECVDVVEQLEPWLVVGGHPFVRRARSSFGPVPPVGPLPVRWRIRPAIRP